MSKPKKVEAKRLKGFQDYMPEMMGARYALMDKIREISGKSGFQPVGTPVLEYAEVLLGQGAETDKQMYRFEDNGGREVGMRFDLTVPFARFVAEHQGELVLPFKRLQMGDVWRAEKPQKGRYREFAQCDLDIIGVDTMTADVEILVCLQKIISQLDCGSFKMIVGNRNILSALIRAKLPGVLKDLESEVLIALDKLDKIGADKVTDLLKNIEGATEEQAKDLLDTLVASKEDFSVVTSLFVNNEEVSQEIERLQKTVALVTNHTKEGLGKIVIDLSIARGLGYYTGMVFETLLDDLPGFGSISSGGRYNDLTARFSKQELQGVGGSIGLDRLLAGMEELNRIPQTQIKEVFIAVATEDAVEYGFFIAEQLRNEGIQTDLSLKANKVSNQFKLAARMGHRLVITIGGQEKEQGLYSLKDTLKQNEERNLPVGELVQTVKSKLM